MRAGVELAARFRLAEQQEWETPPEPLVLAINFGASPLQTPLAQFYFDGPLPLPPPAPLVIAALYPPAALREGVEGQAAVVCALAATGVPTACQIESEAPVGHGFGDAVLGWMRRMPFGANDFDLVAGDQVRMSVAFSQAQIQGRAE